MPEAWHHKPHRKQLTYFIPEWDDLLRAGNYAPILSWFDEHVYRHGPAFTGRQLVERITGGPVDVAPLVRYLESRFGV